MAKKRTKTKAATKNTKSKVPRPKKFVYFFGNGKADGNRTMKDTLGGKGAGLAEMTNAGLPVPAGFTISTDACNLYYEQRQQAARQRRSGDRRQPAQAREGGRRHARLDHESAAGVGALGRQVLDARHDGHDSQPRPQRRSGRRPEGAHQERPLRVRQLPPLHADVRQRRARDSQGDVRARVRAHQDRQERQDGHRPRRGWRCAKSCRRSRASCRSRPASRFRRIRWISCGWRETPCSARGTTRAPRNTAASTTSRIRSAPPSTCR